MSTPIIHRRYSASAAAAAAAGGGGGGGDDGGLVRSAKAPNPATMSTRCCHDINPDMQSFTSIPAPRAAAAAAVDFAFILARSVLSQVSTGALLSICHDRSSSYQNKQGSRIYRTPTPLRYCPWWVSLSTCGGVKYMLSLLNHSEYTSFRVA